MPNSSFTQTCKVLLPPNHKLIYAHSRTKSQTHNYMLSSEIQTCTQTHDLSKPPHYGILMFNLAKHFRHHPSHLFIYAILGRLQLKSINNSHIRVCQLLFKLKADQDKWTMNYGSSRQYNLRQY